MKRIIKMLGVVAVVALGTSCAMASQLQCGNDPFVVLVAGEVDQGTQTQETTLFAKCLPTKTTNVSAIISGVSIPMDVTGVQDAVLLISDQDFPRRVNLRAMVGGVAKRYSCRKTWTKGSSDQDGYMITYGCD